MSSIKLTFNNEEVMVKMYDNPTSKDFLMLLPLSLMYLLAANHQLEISLIIGLIKLGKIEFGIEKLASIKGTVTIEKLNKLSETGGI